jgi:hypothetical protein
MEEGFVRVVEGVTVGLTVLAAERRERGQGREMKFMSGTKEGNV